jgi:hypothetical protein
MILGARNPTRSKNMVIYNNNNNSIQLGQTVQTISPDNFSINSGLNYKKKYQKLGLNIMNPVANFNANVKENTKEKSAVVNLIPNWFDWNYYLNKYEDLRLAGLATEQDAYNHWINNGENEGRECMKDYPLFKQYPNLFHKYLLGLSKSETPMSYEIISETSLTKKFICSIHCYDLNNFYAFFNVYISKLSTFFDFIVTYVNDVNNIRLQYNFTFIKMQNKGMDIGSKFVTVDYLKNKNVPYSYIFFIHSKSCDIHRSKYINPFIKNIYDIVNKMENNHFDAIFNREIGKENEWGRNNTYMSEIVSYLNLDPNFFYFPAGNFYILSKDICESLFTDSKMYNILNTSDSFDYSWVKNFYNFAGDYKMIFSEYNKKKLYGNNLETKLGHSGLADCMIEHVFERLMFLICKRDNRNFYICEKIKGKDPFRHAELTVSVIACHSESSTKINAIVNNVYYLNEISDIIYIVDTDSLKDNNLIQALQNSYPDACINYEITDEKALEYIKENPDLSRMTIDEAKTHFLNYGYKESNRLDIFSCFIFVSYCENYGYCYGKWRYFYEKIANGTKYKNYILANDSFLITSPLNSFDSLIKSDNHDLISLNASNQISYHYTDFLRNYNSASMEIYISFLNVQLSLYQDFLEVIKYIEVPSYKLFSRCACVYDSEPDFFENIHFADDKIMHYLNELNYPIVKIKKINCNYPPNINDAVQILPEGFNRDDYRRFNPDLKNVVDLEEHYLQNGYLENRYYKKGQSIFIYPPLKEYLLNYSSKHPDICKIDFENYTV